MKRTLLLTILFTCGSAQATVTLKQILQSVTTQHPSFKAAQENIKAQHLNHEAQFATTPLSLIGAVADANPDNGDNKMEYSVGIEKEFRFGDAAYHTSQMGHYEHEAMEFSAKKDLLNLQNEAKKLYHLSCIERENLLNYQALYTQIKEVYNKKHRAYEYGELSKKDLLLLELEKDKLKQKIERLQAAERKSRHALLLQSKLPTDSEFSCSDLYPLAPFMYNSQQAYSYSKEIYNRLDLSTQSALKRYESYFETVDVALYYDNEIDIQRVGMALSVPLMFSSTRNEKLRLSALHKRQKLIYEKEALFLNKKVGTDTLKEQLLSIYEQYSTAKQRLDTYKNELMPLVKRSYQLNESSLIEYLLTSQNYNELSQELNEYKKSYYETLFRLYSILEIKE
jgi:hypothetical protein